MLLLLLLLLLLPSALTAFPVADEYCVTLFHSEELVWLNERHPSSTALGFNEMLEGAWGRAGVRYYYPWGRGGDASFREPRRCLSVQIPILCSLIENFD
jgi:hypothetical protein